MLLLLLLLYLTSTAITTNATERPNLKYPDHAKRLHDEPIEGPSLPYGNKVYLKNRLLNNLNHFFPDPGETLEILGATEASQGPPVDTNSIIDQPAATVAPTQTFFAPIQNLLDNALHPDRHPFPTLIPTEATIAPIEPSTPLIAEETTPAKKRSEGPIVSGRILDSIRDWRKRLYRAFKSTKSKSSASRVVDNKIQTRPTSSAKTASEVVDFKDLTPLVVDKNRQVLLSRKEPSWQSALAARNIQTFGREPSGKLVRLFGTEASGYESKPLNDSPPAAIPNDYLPPSPSGDRRAFRTPEARNIVYIPASHVTMRPPPPMTAPAITLPPLVSLPFPPGNVLPDYSSQFTTQQPYGKQYNSFSNQGTRNYPGPIGYEIPASQFITSPPVEPMLATPVPTDSDLDESDESFDPECTGEPSCLNGQLVSEDKCNSLRLRTIIHNNIVPNDAEASKRAVQSAAEEETGLFFDAICGTGFFSYIAHTDEFCLASMGGVNCYVFSPVCSDASPVTLTKLQRNRKKVFVNRN
ncbi:hypothetical protein V3C99_014371 [Haemonchus contortus]